MIDLMIPFYDNKSAPYYEQIYCFIKKEIQSGVIRAGEKLPSTRMLAQKLGVSRSTTQMAYDQLCAEGYLEARPYKGYFAAKIDQLYRPAEKNCEAVFGTSDDGDLRNPEQEEAEADLIDFSPRGIDLENFPFSVWRKLSRDLLQEENRNLFASGVRRGEWRLRNAICQYLQGSRGITCSSDQLVIGAGSEYLLMLLTQLTGIRNIAMENPTYRQASRVMSSMGHQVIPVSMDRYGMKSDELGRSDADMVYVMPSHQFPTGAVMPVARRREIIRWALQRPERYIIEDDYDSEFRYRGKPIPAMDSGEHCDRIIYLGTFSKSVAPAIRVSYMVLPRRLSEEFEKQCGFYTSTVSRLDQEILTRFLEGGYFERHLNRMRGIYRGKHDVLLEELEPLREDFEITGEMAGLHVLLRSKGGLSEHEMIEAAAREGVRVYGISSYFLEPMGSHTILMGFANLSEEQIREGVARCRRAWCGKTAQEE